jgi:hypothetical protein
MDRIYGGGCLRFWMWFWTANFILAGGAFAGIALVVAIRGLGDLRAMLAALDRDRHEKEAP